ncbi:MULTISPECIES: hypothetical protein [Pseudoalteromonas]|uniref:Uncharacterized protein n=1 Tax=Pseudoalteromonas amylolytica TaxID=1859457 RepID=A0A1S1MSN7_9GAMM|nr:MULTISPECIES: hypothetical protein [Pseudoalteromonas]OHU85503.1 hypothetical protein BFC16_19335 [Pseudoalteromonas sp. JW3]OHU91737.1 hypothetical protein BET10_08030 [Pseudoalteromonas amylolytica]
MDFNKIAKLCGTLKTALVTALPASHTNALRKIIGEMSTNEFVQLEHEYNQQSEALLKALLLAEYECGLSSQAFSSAVSCLVPDVEDQTTLLVYYYVVSQLCEAERVYQNLAEEPDILNPQMFYLDRIQGASRLCQGVLPDDLIEWPFSGEAPYRVGQLVRRVVH